MKNRFSGFVNQNNLNQDNISPDVFRIDVALKDRSYPVYIREGLLSAAGDLLAGRYAQGKVLLVADENVFRLYGKECVSSLHKAGFQVYPAVIPAGETSKNMDCAMTLYDAALEAGLDRSGLVLALGGGVVGDLAGFVAATYLRGVPFVQLPTTLLAQVDSSVGGKVGINHPRGKNLIGAFYQPDMVIIDEYTLETLSRREYLAGLGEVFKYGLIGGSEMFAWLEENGRELVDKGCTDKALLREAITRSIVIKGRVVENDEKEKGLRRILNLGHTFGHALEASTGYHYYLHGEGVAEGMRMAVAAAGRLDLLTAEQGARINSLLALLPVKPVPDNVTREILIYYIKYDKKKEGDKINFVLPAAPGEVIVKAARPEDLL